MREWLIDALLMGLRNWSLANALLIAVMNIFGALVA
jgi:hypothetical protein